jgi:hypothetical protein
MREHISNNIFMEASVSIDRPLSPHEMQGVLTAQRQRVEIERLAGERGSRGPDGRFRKGFSGNPKGRPPGIRTVTARLVHALLAQNAEAITGALIVSATTGNVTAQKTCIERLLGVARGQPLELDLALDPSRVGVAVASGRAVDAVGTGEITPEEGADLARVIDTRRRAVEKLWAEEVEEARVIEESDEAESPPLRPPLPASASSAATPSVEKGVMAGLVPAIHARGESERKASPHTRWTADVDGRANPRVTARGHDDEFLGGTDRAATCSPDPSPDHQARAPAKFDPVARAAVRSDNDRKP